LWLKRPGFESRRSPKSKHKEKYGMRTFKGVDQRVFVKQDEHEIAVNKTGVITRICTDGAAWVALENHTGPRVKAYPEDCELPEDTHKERRTAAREELKPLEIIPALFGRDHWTTLLYLEHCITDHQGEPEREKMRCSVKRHPMLAAPHHTEPCHPTRLRDNVLLDSHDDWDCAHDMVNAGWLEELGTSMHPRFQLTDLGWQVAGAVRRLRAEAWSPDKYHERLTVLVPSVKWS
jgi:hypothetical protein